MTAAAENALCGACMDNWMTWLSYRPVRPIQLISIGMTRMPNVMDQIQAAQKADCYDVIRSQQALIARICREHHSQPPVAQRQRRPS